MWGRVHAPGFFHVKYTILKFVVFPERLKTTIYIYNIKHNLPFTIFYEHVMALKVGHSYDLQI
jgi:hypothetical protein